MSRNERQRTHWERHPSLGKAIALRDGARVCVSKDSLSPCIVKVPKFRDRHITRGLAIRAEYLPLIYA
jgi:hypothetical protein